MTTPTRAFAPPCGPVRGRVDGDVVRATGIPYATADRFAAPVPVADREEPFDATRPAPACPQAHSPFLTGVLGDTLAGLPRDEHCQRLSVTLPLERGPAERLPVMVWIHGGSYTTGAGDAPIMDPRPLVAEQRVVVVSVTYRLGLFGYLGAGRGRPANLGLLDQLEALRWVRRNIAAFGGDPDRVTVFGQSAGGDAVAHLMAVPGAELLFRRAILQSPPLGIARGRAAMTAAMAGAAGAVTAGTPAAEVVALQAEVEAGASSFGLRGRMPFGTQYGHHPLPAEEGVEAAWDRVAPHIDVLIGHTAEEARLYLPTLPLLHRVTRVPLLGPVLRRAVVGQVTAAVHGRAVRRFAARHARAGGRAHTYLLTWSAPGSPYGSAHTVDLPLLFGDEAAWAGTGLLAGAPWEDVQAHGRRLRRLWAGFARGEPLADAGAVPGVLRYRAATGARPLERVLGCVLGAVRRAQGAAGTSRAPVRALRRAASSTAATATASHGSTGASPSPRSHRATAR
ncbi:MULTISPECIES: carboxylesterase family protein [Kocuria]|jgi:para-nitrobenzyl esterase|uniref:carboxylesterase family protein n=1 Tax=Kocuria TaxID=57493 RepID=UPI000D641CE6|nr:carboxylesterase family protein [Kocuria rosea]PWF89705.1 carboxylesterase [Kocuria rosea]WJZ67126.1 carboxylesterase family protein [Kocuria rosea]STX03239.1 Para-nitrobenzyl esterase [Kocuria rosea]